MLGMATLKVGTVASIESSTDGGVVHLEDGSTVPYSILVLASGSIWEGPLSLPVDKNEIDGGGAVGAELAGELKDLYPEKAVTIVQGPDMILNSTYKPKFRQIVQKGLTDRGINVIYGDYIDNLNADGTPASAEVTTRNGKVLKDADLVVATRGGKPNTSFLAESGFKVTSSGHVPVEQTLQVKGHSRVFALGDITDIKEQKQAAKYGAHVGVVAANVLAILNKKEATSKYGGSPEIILLTNGKVSLHFSYFRGSVAH
jgi:NADH dehydrogenase FAD-containing subunit